MAAGTPAQGDPAEEIPNMRTTIVNMSDSISRLTATAAGLMGTPGKGRLRTMRVLQYAIGSTHTPWNPTESVSTNSHNTKKKVYNRLAIILPLWLHDDLAEVHCCVLPIFRGYAHCTVVYF